MKNPFQNGTLYEIERSTTIESIDWWAHSTFEGVFMKPIASGEKTQGRLSVLLVKIDPGQAIGRHCHDDQTETQVVVEGSGRCLIDETVFDYRPDNIGLIAQGASHEVRAGEEGLTLIAEFTPTFA